MPKRLTIYTLICGILPFTSCKENNTPEIVPIEDDTPQIETERTASSVREVRATESFYFSIWKEALEKNYLNTISQRSGAARRTPYSGFWYPERQTTYQSSPRGGTHVGADSPLQKYDRAFNNNKSEAVDWELANHTRPSTDPDVGWSGHCNGFSASAQRHDEPKNSVTVGDVTFTPRDIKALLAEVHMSAKFYILGGNRCDNLQRENKPTNRSSRLDPEIMGECEDVNPGTFHLTMTNWIGKQKQVLIIDFDKKDQIWNHPVYAYQIESTEDNLTLADVRSKYITGSTSKYEFNPLATKFAYVRMRITYANAFGASQGEGLGQTLPVNKTYEYLLELNSEGEIIGGEWIRNSVNDHPDFVWVALEPVRGNGDRTGANPYVDPQRVIEIWAESIGADPRNPPLDIVEPIWQNNWGRFAHYDIEIDGDQTGAVFLGKDTEVRIKRKETLFGDVNLLVTLNDAVLKRMDLTGNNDIDFSFTPRPGVHRLGLQWSKGSSIVDSRYVRIHVTR